MRVWLIRHPAPAVEPGICYGRLDLSTVEAPATAAARLRAVLPPLSLVVASPLVRCRLVAAHLSPAPEIDARLVEMNFGEWEGRAWDRIDRAALDAWAADPFGYRPPGGESAREMGTRVVSFAADFSSRVKAFGAAPCEVAIVAHQGPLRVLAAHWLGESESTWLDRHFDFGKAIPVTVST